MLEIKTGKVQGFNEETNEFVDIYKGPTFLLEHSLLSISKWEAKYKKPFLSGKDDKSQEELIDYFQMMVVEGDPNALIMHLDQDNLKAISHYISEDTQTATTFSDDGKPSNNREIITSEVIYYMVFANRIDKECERWHLNRLMTLLKVFSEKNKEADPNQKNRMSQSDIIARNRALNEARKKKLGTKG